MLAKYLRKIHHRKLASAMDTFYQKVLQDYDYQDLNKKWGHKTLQFNLETPFERKYKDKFIQNFKGSILEIGCGLTPLDTQNEYTGIDISSIPAQKFSQTISIDFLDFPTHQADLIYSQDGLMPKMAKDLKTPNQAFIICNGVKGLNSWIKKIKINEVIEVEDFLSQVENMKALLQDSDCDTWIKNTRMREFESILELNLKRFILIKK